MKRFGEKLLELSHFNESVDGWTDGCTDRQTDGRTDGQTDGQCDYYTAPTFSMWGPN